MSKEKSTLKIEIGAIVSTFLAFSLSPLILFGFILPLYTLRFFISLCSKLLKKDYISILPYRNSIWASDFFAQNEVLGTICVASVVKGQVSLEQLTQTVSDKLINSHKYSQLKWTIEKFCGYPFFKEISNFDIKDYIKSYKNDEIIWDSDISQISEELSRAPWPHGSSGWRIFCINDYRTRSEPKVSKTCAIFLLHHAFGDAKSAEVIFLHELTQLADVSQPPLEYPDRDFPRKELDFSFPIISLYQSIREFLRVWDVNPFKITESESLSQNREREISYANHTNVNEMINFESIRQICDQKGISILSLEACAISGGIEKFLKSLKIPISQFSNEEMHLIWTYSCSGHDEKLSNYHSDVFFKLPFNSKYPDERLESINDSIEEQKASNLPEANLMRLKILGGLPLFLIEKLFKILPPTGIMININAPNEPVYFHGNLVEDIRFSCGPLPGVLGFYIFILRYMNDIRIGVGISKNLVKNGLGSEKLLKCILQEFKFIESL